MLSRFFGERIGGVRFFDELTRLKQDPLLNYDVLELQHTCLALGFQGIHRTSAGGISTLQQIQRDLYETLRRVRPKVYRELSPRWQGQKLATAHGTCIRAMVGRCGFCRPSSCSAFTFVYLYWLTGGVDVAANGMASLLGTDKLSLERKVLGAAVPPPLIPAARARSHHPNAAHLHSPGPGSRRRQGLRRADRQPDHHPRRQHLLFNSGVANVLEQFKPIGERIAATLDKEDGLHQGDRSHRQYADRQQQRPLSLQLSALDRARQERRGAVQDRPWPSPIACRPTARARPRRSPTTTPPDGRAKNRRVEIVIPRTDTGPVSERTCTQMKRRRSSRPQDCDR